MVSALFQPEISSLESQVAALQAQIAAAKLRITVLGEVESEADGALQALTNAVEKVSALAPSAIATLKATVMNLFNSDGDGDTGGSDKPEPQPEPPLNGESCDINPDAYIELPLTVALGSWLLLARAGLGITTSCAKVRS